MNGSSASSSRRSGAPMVLVVEDDPAVRLLFAELLRGGGYKAVVCEDGVRGLEAARANIDALDAVITDTILPGLDSREMIAAIRALRPEIPVLVVSGNAQEAAARFAGERGMTILAKPFSPEQLTAALQQLIGRLPDLR